MNCFHTQLIIIIIIIIILCWRITNEVFKVCLESFVANISRKHCLQ